MSAEENLQRMSIENHLDNNPYRVIFGSGERDPRLRLCFVRVVGRVCASLSPMWMGPRRDRGSGTTNGAGAVSRCAVSGRSMACE
jgi:hypothetical protein